MRRLPAIRMLTAAEAGLDSTLHALREAVYALAGDQEMRPVALASFEALQHTQQLLIQLRHDRGRLARAIDRDVSEVPELSCPLGLRLVRSDD